MKHKGLFFIIVIIAALFIVSRYTGLGDYLSFEYLQANRALLLQKVQANYVLAVGVYIGLFSCALALALPVVAPLTVVGGFLFGVVFGTIYASLSSTAGSVIYYLIVRFLLANTVKGTYQERLNQFNKQINQYGYTYLLTMQWLTIFPFFVINTLAALAQVPFVTFLWTTIVGGLPFIIIFALAGKELGSIKKISDILSLEVIILFILLALLALVPMLIQKWRATQGK